MWQVGLFAQLRKRAQEWLSISLPYAPCRGMGGGKVGKAEQDTGSILQAAMILGKCYASINVHQTTRGSIKSC